MSGRTQGLTLILDAHSDLVTASSITDYFQVCVVTEVNFDATKVILKLQGFQAIIDSPMDYPMASRKNILIRPGHLVCNNEIIKL